MIMKQYELVEVDDDEDYSMLREEDDDVEGY